jgi:site-specific DNA recombinase
MNQTLSTSRRRALAYVRISSQRQINGESPETQQSSIKDYADRNNIDIVATFYDEAKSGKNTDRSELQNMLKYAEKNKGEIDHVIVYKMNRASRDMATYITGFLTPLKKLDISVRSATEPIDDSVMGQFMEMFNILIGQMDNNTKRGFTVDNMTSLAHQGYWQHPPIVGYEIHKITNDVGKLRPSLKPNAMAPHVKNVLLRFSQGDITKAELSRYAASIGLRSRYGKKLSQDSIHRLLSHPVYAGYILDNFTKGELIEGKHEAIISRDVYDLNQTLLYGKRKRAGEVRQMFNPDYPLKGLVLCPNCMKPLYASAPRTGGGGKSPRYHCSRSTCKGLYKSIKASVMHDDFEDLLSRIKPDDRILTLYKEVLIAESIKQLGNVNVELSKLRSKLSTIESDRLSAIRKFNNDQLTHDEKELLTNELDNEHITLSKDIRKLDAQRLVRQVDIDVAIATMNSVDQQWLVASPQSKQRFQSMIFPEGLVYDYEQGRFGTSQISHFYRLIATKKDSEEPSKSFLVAGAGFEPATCWL